MSDPGVAGPVRFRPRVPSPYLLRFGAARVSQWRTTWKRKPTDWRQG
jgi:hypothetical protein